MSGHYNGMKKEMGFGTIMGEDEELPKLETVMAQIKPNLKASNFKSLMNRQENIHKDVKNKKICRAVHQSFENARFKNTNLAKNFVSAKSMRYSLDVERRKKSVE